MHLGEHSDVLADVAVDRHDGLDPELKARADGLIRISSMTLPHGIVRVMLAEQIYRAWSNTQNHPYPRV